MMKHNFDQFSCNEPEILFRTDADAYADLLREEDTVHSLKSTAETMLILFVGSNIGCLFCLFGLTAHTSCCKIPNCHSLPKKLGSSHKLRRLRNWIFQIRQNPSPTLNSFHPHELPMNSHIEK
jgi:hypothetical protein